MNGMELIRHRRSVRTFDGNPLRREDAQELLRFSQSISTPYGIPITWKLLSAKEDGLSSPVIVGTDTYIAGKLKRQPHAEEAFGYAFEKLVLRAEAMGIGTTWIAGTMDRPAFEKAMQLNADEAMPCVSPLGYPAKRMSLRETMMRKGVRADSRMEWRELFFDRSFVKKWALLRWRRPSSRTPPNAWTAGTAPSAVPPARNGMPGPWWIRPSAPVRSW